MAQLRLSNIEIVVISLIINKIHGLSGQICSKGRIIEGGGGV